jgi:hypothetical protein
MGAQSPSVGAGPGHSALGPAMADQGRPDAVVLLWFLFVALRHVKGRIATLVVCLFFESSSKTPMGDLKAQSVEDGNIATAKKRGKEKGQQTLNLVKRTHFS